MSTDHATSLDDPPATAESDPPRQARRARPSGWRVAGVAVIAATLGTELVLGWPSLARAVAQFRTPHPGWLSAAVLVEMASMRAYARMQRRLLRSAGLRVSLVRHIALAYAAHSLSVTLPGGPAFSTSFNYQQMRRFGAIPAVAASCIALSGIMSSTALAILGVLGGIAAHGRPNWPFMVAEIAAFAAVGYAGYRLIRHPGVLDRAGGLADTVIARVRRRTAEPGPGPVTALLTQLRSVRMRPRQVTAAGGYAFANWLLDALCLWMSCVAVGASHLTATGVLIAYCAGMAAGSALPVIPGGLGVIDSALILGLIAGGLDAGLAIAGVLLYRAISLGFIIGTGWIFWLIIRRRSRAEPARSRAAEPAGNG